VIDSSTATDHTPVSGSPHGDVAPGAHEARPRERQQFGGALGCVALADPAEVEPVSALELDPLPLDDDSATALGGRRRVAVRRDVVERPVVPRLDEGVVDGRVEATTGALPRIDGEPHDLGQVG
jgi:hypothetical protein